MDAKNIRLIASWILDRDYDIMIPKDMDANDSENEDFEIYPFDNLLPIGMKMTIHHQYYLCK